MQGSSFQAAIEQSWVIQFNTLIAIVLFVILALFLLVSYLNYSFHPAVTWLVHSGVFLASLGLFLEVDHNAAIANSGMDQPLIAKGDPGAIGQQFTATTKTLAETAFSQPSPHIEISAVLSELSHSSELPLGTDYISATFASHPSLPQATDTKIVQLPSGGNDACEIKLPANVNQPKKFSVVKWDSRRISKYDDHFKKYTQRYFNDETDWRWFKVQAFVESGMRQSSVSSAGAIGIMQIMPSTYRQIQKMNAFFRGKSIHNIEWNIAAGIYYNSYLWKQWMHQEIQGKQLRLMFASYNAGLGRVTRTFLLGKRQYATWLDKQHRLPKETKRYIKKITFHMKQLRGAAFVHPDEFCREVIPFKPLQIVASYNPVPRF